ncbi:MAG: plasmid pRiA4b ORF-3 family protein [Actinomycetota bacterium]|nr:plasmid pRiA4b ORF-3 family protein [Actinomycetota bacterium]
MAAARRITAKTRIFQLKIQLAGIRPPVWRRVLVPDEIDLGELHEVIQTAFGWTNSHLHQFEIGTARYGTPDPDWEMDDVADESQVKLARLVSEGDRMNYVYDFGDNWVHHVLVEKVLQAEPATRYPTCTAGRRAGPPEDVGGPWGYGDFLQALDDPKHDEHKRFSDWIGEGTFDPDAFDLASSDAALAALAWRAGPLRSVP